jgi:hypothetical protein
MFSVGSADEYISSSCSTSCWGRAGRGGDDRCCILLQFGPLQGVGTLYSTAGIFTRGSFAEARSTGRSGKGCIRCAEGAQKIRSSLTQVM